MGSEQGIFVIDEKVWQRVELRAGPFWLADATSELCTKLRSARVECSFYGAYALVKASGALRFGDIDGQGPRPLSDFGIDPVELSYVVLRREVKRAVNEAFDEDDGEDDEFWTGSPVWNELLARWKQIGDQYDTNPVFLFARDLLLFCLRNNIDYTVNSYTSEVRITVCKKKALREVNVVDCFCWRMYKNFKVTEATPDVMAALKNTNGAIYVRVEFLVFVYMSTKYEVQNLRDFYSVVEAERGYLKRGVKEEEARSKVVTAPRNDFLSKSNFYDIVARQVKANPGQTAFYFEKSDNCATNWAFEREVDKSDQFFRRSLPLVNVCFLKGTGSSTTDGWMFIVITMTLFALATFGSLFWCAITSGPTHLEDQYHCAISALFGLLVADGIYAFAYLLFIFKHAKKLVIHDQ